MCIRDSCYTTFGVTYFEHWNEPDQQWLNPIMVKFFWTGDEYELYNAYAAIADEVSADTTLAHNVKLGGCLLYTSPSSRDRTRSRMPSSA